MQPVRWREAAAWAAGSGRADCLRLDYGADVDARNDADRESHWAAADACRVLVLIESGVDGGRQLKRLPPHYASKNGHADCAAPLDRADVNAHDWRRKSALDVAAGDEVRVSS